LCGIAGLINLNEEQGIDNILTALQAMEERGTEHGAGFAAYNPEPSGLVRLRIFIDESKGENELADVVRRLGALVREPPRRIAYLGRGFSAYEAHLYDYPPSSFLGSLRVLQASRFLKVWKSIGWPHEVVGAYGAWHEKSIAWIGHTRYPTNSPGFSPWLAHPFTYLETAIVHNGDLSSYGANKRLVELLASIRSFTGNDSEVIAYLAELLFREGYEAEDVIDAMIYGKHVRWARLDGPYAVILLRGTARGPLFAAFVDRHHLRPLYVALENEAVYVASEAAAIKAMEPSARPRLLRGGGRIIVYPDGELVAKGLAPYKVLELPNPPRGAIDASKLERIELNQLLAKNLAEKGYAAAYNLLGHRYVANGLGPGVLELWGIVGNASLNLVEGLEARIYGQAQEDLGDCAENSKIIVYGDVGDSAAQAMRSGELHVTGNAGNRLAVQLKGGVVVVRGNVGDYLAEFMAGGRVVVLGRPGKYIATGMVGGKIYIRGHVPLGYIGKAPQPRQVERYIKSLAARGEISQETMIRALQARSIYELKSILGERFGRLAKLWGVLHIGYPHAEYRYLTSEEEEELKTILEQHVEATRIPMDVEEALTHRYTIITSAKIRD
jgi:glutamate synthase domain-containing protein 1/glutamate synthase domain-containing protein 3